MDPKHLKQVHNIETSTFKRPYSQNHLEYLARVCPETFLLALIDNHPAGYVAAFITGEEAHIMSIAIDLKWRRKGIGKSLMLEIMDKVKKLGVREIHLEVKESNNSAIELYEKLGFKQINKINDYYEKCESALVFSRIV